MIILYADRQKHRTNQLQHKLPNRFGLCGSIIVSIIIIINVSYVWYKMNQHQI